MLLEFLELTLRLFSHSYWIHILDIVIFSHFIHGSLHKYDSLRVFQVQEMLYHVKQEEQMLVSSTVPKMFIHTNSLSYMNLFQGDSAMSSPMPSPMPSPRGMYYYMKLFQKSPSCFHVYVSKSVPRGILRGKQNLFQEAPYTLIHTSGGARICQMKAAKHKGDFMFLGLTSYLACWIC